VSHHCLPYFNKPHSTEKAFDNFMKGRKESYKKDGVMREREPEKVRDRES
jgi:hypothetical protein